MQVAGQQVASKQVLTGCNSASCKTVFASWVSLSDKSESYWQMDSLQHASCFMVSAYTIILYRSLSKISKGPYFRKSPSIVKYMDSISYVKLFLLLVYKMPEFCAY